MTDDNVKALRILPSSRLSGLRAHDPDGRRQRLVESRWLSPEEAAELARGGALDEATADALVENVIGVHALPLAVATNFRLNGEDRLVPMSVEEPSIVAACSYAARMVTDGGGFVGEADPPLLAAQVELLDVPDVEAAQARILAQAESLLSDANALLPHMCARGGGARELEVRVLAPDALCVHVLVDCRDALGANLVNSVAEGLSPRLAGLAGARPGLRILTNLSDRRKVYLRAQVPLAALESPSFPDGARVRDGILEAQRFAERDVYRAATHNKGVMNGVDAVLLACGNDWRAVEAGAHAWAARHGRYAPLTRWWKQPDGALAGELVMPLATSTVGGAARSHPGVRLSLRLARAKGAVDLAMLAGAAGLASNLAALKALSTEGIQRGHMSLHARRVAAEAGAEGELVEKVALRLSRERVYRPERAREILEDEVARRRGVP